MSKTKISSKGQVVIPHEIRSRYGLREGLRVEWIPWDADAVIVRKSTHQKKLTWREWLKKVDKLDKSVWKGVDPVKYTHELWNNAKH